MAQATYTPAIDEKLRRWAAEGVLVTEQARRLNVTTSRVHGWRRRLGMTSLATREVAPELHQRILGWVEDRWPVHEIAETAGMNIAQVRLRYPEARWTPTEQGSLGAAVRRAIQKDRHVMRGL